MEMLFSDVCVFTLCHLIFFIIFIGIALFDKGYFRKGGGVIAEVKRGATSWGYFHTVYGFLSIIFLELINTTEAFKGYKTFVTIIDLSILLYLCFFSTWFRGNIVRIMSSSKEMTERQFRADKQFDINPDWVIGWKIG